MNCNKEIDYSKYLTSTPETGGEYFILAIPENIMPPKVNQEIFLSNKNIKHNVVVHYVSTSEDFAKGRGGPVAKSMVANGIGWLVNCLPKGHKYLEKNIKTVSSLKNKIAKIAEEIIANL